MKAECPAVFFDVTGSLNGGGELQADYSVALHAAKMGFWEFRVGLDTWRWSAEVCSLIGRSSDPRCIDAPLSALIHPSDELRVRAKLAESLAAPDQSLYQDEFRILRPDGESCWFLSRGQITRDRVGAAQVISGVLLDITDRKRIEDELKRSNAELEHRTQNVLSIVQSIAVRSFVEESPIEEVRDIFLERLHALARAYGALANGHSRGASLLELVRGEIEQFGARADMDGPAIILTPTAARSLALMIHELAAQSARIGALSVPGGKITVQWAVDGGTVPNFTLRWSERGIPRRRPRTNSDSAPTFLDKVSAAFGIGGRLEHTPWGLKYEVDIPLSVIEATDEGAAA